MPQFTVDMIKEHAKVFKIWDWERFIREINDYRWMYNITGDSCDEQTWNELIYFAKQKIEELTKKGKE